MKWLALLLVVALGFAGYHAHVQSLKEAEEKATLEAYNQAQAQIENERIARAEHERKAAEAREQRPQLAVAKALEPLVTQVTASLNLQEPADLLPIVESTKQRILENRADAEPARAAVYDRAAAALNFLATLADERTKALKSMIRNRAAGTNALGRSEGAGFFNQGVIKHWDETLGRARPTMTQLLDQLRLAERAWNKQAQPGGTPEQYDLAGLTPVMLPLDPPQDTTLLARPAASPAASRMRSAPSTSGQRQPAP